MRIRACVSVLLACCVACGDDSPPATSADLDGSMSNSCSGAPTADVLLSDVRVGALAATRDGVVFEDLEGGVEQVTGNSGAIRTLRRDGSGDSVLFAAASGTTLKDMVVYGDNVYFLLDELLSEETRAYLYALPVAGGEPERIAPSGDVWFDAVFADLIAVDSEFAYVADARDKKVIVRVALADGSETVIAEHDGGLITNAQMVGDRIWYTPDQAFGGIYYVEARADGLTTPTRVGTSTCAFGLSATHEAYYCAGSTGVERYDFDGVFVAEVFDTFDDPGGAFPGPYDGEALYLHPINHSLMPRALRRLNLSDQTSEVLVCDVGIVSIVSVGERDIYWYEETKDGDNYQTLLKHISK